MIEKPQISGTLLYLQSLSHLVKEIIFDFAETPQPSEHCPRKHGYFAHSDPKICDKFYFCVDGKFNMITCPDGLVYSAKTGTCTWPDQAQKKHCSSEGQSINYANNFSVAFTLNYE